MIEEGIDLDGYLVVEKDEKNYIVCKNKQYKMYRKLKEGEGEKHEKNRGYTIHKN